MTVQQELRKQMSADVPMVIGSLSRIALSASGEHGISIAYFYPLLKD
jgi:hypothetical protein